MFGCRPHWFGLPKRLRGLILKFYVPGQEITKTPSVEYLAAVQAAQEWIRNRETSRGGIAGGMGKEEAP